MKMAAMAEKMPDSIDLTLGEPDIPTPEIICSALYDAAKGAKHTMHSGMGLPGLRALPYRITGKGNTVLIILRMRYL